MFKEAIKLVPRIDLVDIQRVRPHVKYAVVFTRIIKQRIHPLKPVFVSQRQSQTIAAFSPLSRFYKIAEINRFLMRIKLDRGRDLETIYTGIEAQIHRGPRIGKTGRLHHRRMHFPILPARVAKSGHRLAEQIFKPRFAFGDLTIRLYQVDSLKVAMVIGVRADFEPASDLLNLRLGHYRKALPIVDRNIERPVQSVLLQQFSHLHVGWMTVIRGKGKYGARFLTI